ncbi:MAG: phosphatase PAP2 family protein [Chloroflexota bacterium]
MQQVADPGPDPADGAPRPPAAPLARLQSLLDDPRPPRRPLPGPRTRVRLAAAGGIVLGLGLLLAALVALAPEAVAALDVPAGRAFRDAALAHPLLAGWAEAWSFAADGPRNVLAVAVVAVALVRARAWPWAAFLVFTTQAGVLLSNILKLGIGRARPELVEQGAGQATLSFPSGHSFAGLTVWAGGAIVALYVLPRRWGRLAAAGCLAVGLLQPPARLLLGRHWLSDTAGGQLLGLGWLLLCWAVFCTLLVRQGLAADPDGERGA